MANKIPANDVEQAIRKSHCSYPVIPGQNHSCVGTCKITPAGIELDCTICGDGDNSIWYDPKFFILKEALEVIGINALTLTEYSVKEMVRILNTGK